MTPEEQKEYLRQLAYKIIDICPQEYQGVSGHDLVDQFTDPLCGDLSKLVALGEKQVAKLESKND